jgi:atypical dual specificity phosphatase
VNFVLTYTASHARTSRPTQSARQANTIDGGNRNRNTPVQLDFPSFTLAEETDLDWITHDIAIGNCDDARRFDKLRSAGIESILSLTGWPNSASNGHGLTWRCVELIDGHGNDVSRLHDAIWQLHELLAKGSVLVHCMEGVSRSPLVVASYLADKAERPFEDCLQEVARLRKWVSLQPGLIDLRRAYETAIRPHQRIGRLSSQHGVVHTSGD